MRLVSKPYDDTTMETIKYLFKYIPYEASIGLFIIVCFFIYLFIKERFIVAIIFIIIPSIGAYLRSILATKPFFEMFQFYKGDTTLYDGSVPESLNFLYYMSSQNWLDAAFYYGALLNISLGYISFYFIRYAIKKIDAKTVMSLILLSIKSLYGNKLKDYIKKMKK